MTTDHLGVLDLTPDGWGSEGPPLRSDVLVPARHWTGDEHESYAVAPGLDEDQVPEGFEPELEDLAEPERPDRTWPVQVRPGRLVVERLPLLAKHVGIPPDLVLRWGAMSDPGPVDVVVHLHGYSGKGKRMHLVRDKEPISGLDLSDPSDPTVAGRSTPTLLVLPRGHFFGGRSGMGYAFPALQQPGKLRELLDDALRRFGAETGASPSLGRLVITAHSGGGAALMAVLRHLDPDEVHSFDALYGDPSPLIAWARRRMSAETGAMRVLFRAGEGTARNSLAVASAVGSGSPHFRVEQTRVSHNDMPRRYGWRLLADPAADLPGASRPTAGRTAKESFELEHHRDETAYEHFFESPFVAEQQTGWLSAAVDQDEGRDDEGDEFEGDEASAVGSLGLVAGEPAELESWQEQPVFEPPAFEELDFEELDFEEQPDAAAFAEAYQQAYDELEGEDEEREEAAEVEVGEWETALEDEGGLQHESFPSGVVLARVTGATGKGEEHWDPKGPGLPLYATGAAVRGKKLSTSFTVGELVTSGGRAADVARISVDLVRLLQAIRDRVGKPVKVTSGYRSWARNVAVYRARKKEPTQSRHCSGQAADISIPGMTGMQIAKAALDAYGDRIGVGIAGTFAHVDVRGTWTVWTYFSGEADRRAKAEIEAHRKALGQRPAPRPSPTPTPTPDTTPPPGPAGSDRAAGKVTLGAFVACTSGELPGARSMADQWRRLTGRRAGTYNCRLKDSGTPSLHGEGRAVDLHGLASRPDERAQADAYVAWLVQNAVELQVAVVIWNRQIWSWGRRAQGFRPYGGKNPHVDHIHVDLSREGARLPSRLFSGDVPGLRPGGAPARPPAPPPSGGVPAHVVDFVRTYDPHAAASQAATSVPSLVTLGQAALESGWGRKAPGFNFFGIKARASDPEATRQLITTREVLSRPDAVFPEVVSVTRRPDGRYDYVVRDWFRRYPSAQAAFAAHGALLRGSKRYAAAFGHTADPYAFARAVAAAGYATDPRYAESLTGVMRLLERAGATR